MKFYTFLTLFIGLNLGFQAPVFAMEQWDTGDFDLDSEGTQPITLSKIHQRTNQVKCLALEFDMEKYHPSKNGENFQNLIKNINEALSKKDILENKSAIEIGLIWVYLNESKDSLEKAQAPFKKISGIKSIMDAKDYSTNTKLYFQLLERNKPYIDPKAFDDLEKDRKKTKKEFENQKMIKELKAIALSESVSERSNRLEIKQSTEFDTELNFSSDEE